MRYVRIGLELANVEVHKFARDDVRCQPFSTASFHVWDSRYGRPTEAFSIFRETICNTFMPWTPEILGSIFEGRVESISLEDGVIGRVRMTPIVAEKTKQNIANSIDECIHGNFILSGELKVVQGDRINIAKPGDLVLYQSFSPVTLTVKSDELFDNLAFIVPKSKFSYVPYATDKFSNCLLTKDTIIQPLASCLELITENLHSLSHDELSAIFNACVSLVPLSAGFLGRGARKPEIPRMSDKLREVLNFIHKKLSDPELSPHQAARELGVSTRYIHKLLAHAGTTFSAHVTRERLEHIKSELTAFSGRHVPVSLLAFQWGFNDLSTFNRAFKERFGCTPSDFARTQRMSA
jgi:AraC family transcriptional regulator, positive regulator of tynA and feaB